MTGRFMALAFAGGIALVGLSVPAPAAAQDFTITSTAFQDGGWLQQKNAGSDKARNPNCSGENVSPPLAFNNLPAKAISLALLMVDPEGRAGAGSVHWVAYGIAPSVTGFAEGEASKPSPKFVGGIGSSKQSIYVGPCTSAGAPHHYVFTLIATTLAPTDLPPGLTREQFFEKSDGKRFAATGLVGLWAKK